VGRGRVLRRCRHRRGGVDVVSISRSELLRLLAPLPLVGWVLSRIAAGEWRWEFLLFLVVAPLIAWRRERLFWGLYPFALLGLVYDAMRFVKDLGVTPERLHVCDLRALDARWFGANGTTVHDLFRAHPSPILDALCAVPYGTFLYVAIAFAVFLYARDYAAMKRFGWTFLLVNVAGFVTYHLYPAAPPWYFHAHGCVADLSVRASEGAPLARVDAWLPFPYFARFYARSSEVFGAVPSLHVAYPLLVLIHGWPHFRAFGRSAAAAFFFSMCFAAIYLDHHWVIDVLLGIALTLFVHRAIARAVEGRGAHDPKRSPPPLGPPVGRGEKVAYALATWFGCGYAPVAPGTVGTFGALPLYVAFRFLGGQGLFVAAVLLAFAAVWSAGVVVRRSGLLDPQIVVIDEVVGVLIVLAASPPTALGTLAGVALFRLFDVVKPWPVFVAERALPGGWGVVFDDVLAGVWGAAAMTVLAGMGAL
jgi:phosphatidylglycerophosphatase A